MSEKIKTLESNINDHIDRYPELKHDTKLIESIPGIGTTTIAKVLAYFGDVRRSRSAKTIASQFNYRFDFFRN